LERAFSLLHSRRRRTRGGPARIALAARCLLLAGALGACARPDADAAPAVPAASADTTAAIAVRDDVGRTVTLAQPARRVISLIPAQTEIVKRLAGARVLVARTAWDADPELAHLPSTGNALTPSIEWLAAQRPDLVIAWPDQQSRSVITQLEDMHIAVYASAVETLADVDSMIVRLGTLLGRRPAADTLRTRLRAELDAVARRVAGRDRPRAFYALSLDPPMAATSHTYIGELLELAGAANIFPELAAPWAQVSLEEILRRDPEVIIRPLEEPRGETLARLRAQPGWRDLAAVRAGRVHEVDADLLNRPGATLGEAARVLARALHPEAFAP
jgi:iron complex transport system substrate-binding protein